MQEKRDPINVAILAMPETTASVMFGIHDMLCSAGRDWSLLVHGKPGPQKIQSYIVSNTTGPFSIANGVTVQAHYTFGNCPPPDIICVPELFIAPEATISSRYDREIHWLTEAYRGGAILATACSGALLLAESGLLDGQDATTHWGYCDTLGQRYPAIRVHPDRALVISGTDQRIVMAGGGTSWLDLILYLVGRILSIEEAVQLAKVYLVDWHDLGQLPYASLTCKRQADDSLIQKCQAWLASNYHKKNPVSQLIDISGLPERSFKRRFAKATGMSPMEYVHTLRVEEAKQMLETTSHPVDAIANETGYEDASFFGRLFRRKVGVTPARYRRRFSGIRHAVGTESNSAATSG